VCLSVRECVCVCLCDFLRELLHFGHCKLLYCFGSILFFFAFFFLFIFFFFLFFFFLFFVFVFLFVFIFSFSFASFCQHLLVYVILFSFGIFFLLSIFFSFLFLPFSTALSVYVTRLLVKGTFSILLKGYKRVSVHWARESRTRRNKWGFWWQEFELSFNHFVCLSRRLL